MFGRALAYPNYFFFFDLPRAPREGTFKPKYSRSDLVIFLSIIFRKRRSREISLFLRFFRFLERGLKTRALRSLLRFPFLTGAGLAGQAARFAPHPGREVSRTASTYLSGFAL